MEITKELISTIYSRAYQYCIAKHNEHIDYIKIDQDGIQGVSYVGNDREYFDINIDKLSQDLDILIKEREEREEKARIENEKIRAEQKRNEERIAKELRFKQFQKLKREFENESTNNKI